MDQAEKVARGYSTLIEHLVSWANGREDIRGAFIIGSRAREDHPADEWSDLDLFVLAANPATYSSDSAWLENLGEYWVSFTEPTPDGRSTELRVLFAGGLDVDFVFLPAAVLDGASPGSLPPGLAAVTQRGVRVVLDKDGALDGLRPMPLTPPAAPGASEFLNVVENFWYHTLWSAKHLRRGELWWAKSGVDMHLKGLLCQMMEWHAQVTGAGRDTWLRGRFLEQWADPRAVAALAGTFAHYDEADVWRALFATMDLFRWLSREAAARLEYPYPDQADIRTSELVQRLAAGAQLISPSTRDRQHSG